MKHWRNIGYSENEDTKEKTLPWQCEVCVHILAENMRPKECPACFVREMIEEMKLDMVRDVLEEEGYRKHEKLGEA